MIPELVKIGPLTINSFGVMAMLGFLVPMILLRREMARRKMDPDLANGIIITAMIGGFVGARIYFIAERWDTFFAAAANQVGVYAMLIAIIPAYFLKKTLEKQNKDKIFSEGVAFASVIGVLLASVILYVYYNAEQAWGEYVDSPSNLLLTGAGLVWYGGLIGGFLGVYWYVKRKGVSFPLVCDLMAPLLALGQMFGRAGCLLSGDGDYGPPTDVPWAMSFPNGIVPTTEQVHPTPLYDMILLFAIFLFLWNIRKKEMPTLFKFSFYLILVGAERIFTEFFRTTPEILFGLTMAQLISIGLIIAGVGIILYLKNGRDSSSTTKISPSKAKIKVE